MAPLVSVLLLCYNNLKYTKQCVATLQKNTNPDLYELVAVDNASTDGTLEFLNTLATQMTNLKVVSNSENLGFVGGNNLGAEYAEGHYLLFLNNDTEPQMGWLEPLINLMEEDDTIGAVGSKLIYPDGRLQEAGGIIFRDGSGWNYGRYDEPDNPEYNYLREVDYCSGAGLMVLREVFNELSGFDELFAPAYYEDADLCFAIRKLGYRVMYQPCSHVVHHEGVTAGTDTNKGYKRYQEINREKFVNKWEVELTGQPPVTSELQFVRSVSDRRCRQGKQILVAAYEIPQYDRQGGALRIFNHMRLLSKAGHHVTFVAHNTSWRENDVALEPYVKKLQELGILVYGLDRLYRDRGRIVPAEHSMVKILQNRKYDVALLWSAHDAQWFIERIYKYSLSTRVVVDSVDLAYIREAREASLLNSPTLWSECHKRKEIELSSYRHADSVMVMSETERQLLGREINKDKLFVVNDQYSYPDDIQSFEEREGLVFLAGYRHRPNIDAAMYLLDKVMPLVHQQMPDIPIMLLGADPPEIIRNKANDRTIVTGFVEDIQPYLAKSRIALAPVRYGAGINGKINQAMAVGTPNVTTSMGAEGLNLENGHHSLIADTPEEFADAIVSLYNDREQWERISEASRKRIKSRHSPEGVLNALLSVLFPVKPKADTKLPVEIESQDLVGRAYMELNRKDLDSAEQLFMEAVNKCPNLPDGHLGLGKVYLEMREYDEAEQCIEKSIALSEYKEEAQILLAELYKSTGNLSKATEVLNSINISDQNLMRILGKLIKFYDSLGKIHLLLDKIEKFDFSDSNDPQLLGKLSELFARGGKINFAISILGKGIESNTPDIEPLKKTLDLIIGMGKQSQALSAAENLALIYPKSFQCWYILANLQTELGQGKRGEKSWTKAIELAPRIIVSWVSRGAIRYRMGDSSSALIDYAHAANLALDANRYDIACGIDSWMSIIAAGLPLSERVVPDQNSFYRYYRDSQVLDEIGFAIGRSGPISSYELDQARTLWLDVLSGNINSKSGSERLANYEAIVSALAEVELKEAIKKDDELITKSIRAGIKTIKACSSPGSIPEELMISPVTSANGIQVFESQVDIIIPIYGQPELLRRCVESVLETTEDAGLILVDDCSPGDENETLRLQWAGNPRITFIRTPENQGFIGACSLGAKLGKSPHILFLNSDIEAIEPNWLDKLIPGEEDVAIVGAKLLYPPNSPGLLAGSIQHAGVARNSDGIPYHPYLGWDADTDDVNERRFVNAVTGACLLIRREIWDEMGGWDAQFGKGVYEDVDLCWRVQKAGYRVLYQPEACLYHHSSASISINGRHLLYENKTENLEKLIAKWKPISSDERIFYGEKTARRWEKARKQMQRSRSALENKNIKVATIAMKKAVQIAPDLPDALVGYAQLQEVQGKNSAAAEYYEKALAIAPALWDLRIKLVDVLLEAEKHESAARELQKLRIVFPALPEVREREEILKGYIVDNESEALPVIPGQKGNGFQNRAEETLRLLLESDDIQTALQENVDNLEPDLLELVRRDASAARADGDIDLAEGLVNLAEYIEQVIVNRTGRSEAHFAAETLEEMLNADDLVA